MNFNKEKKENLMRIVMLEVEEAIKEGNSPFGAILIDENGNIIEKAHNTAKSMCNPVLHAEIRALKYLKFVFYLKLSFFVHLHNMDEE